MYEDKKRILDGMNRFHYAVEKIGAKIVRHGRSIIFQMAEAIVPRDLFEQILGAIAALRPLPPSRC